jgi:protein gp37
MSDLFHEEVPLDFIQSVFETMRMADKHTFQILTKRSKRLAELASRLDWPDNVWMGVSVENQRWSSRIDDLRTVDAAIRFLSCEPLLGPLILDLEGIHWVIAGGESGRRARRMNPGWARDIRDQCLAAGVPFFFKQWGAHDQMGVRVGKTRAGRMLDDAPWNQFPGQTNLINVPGG